MHTLFKKFRIILALLICLQRAPLFGQAIGTADFRSTLREIQQHVGFASSTDPEYHLHYNLEAYSDKGNVTAGTYDHFYSALQRFRTELTLGAYRSTTAPGQGGVQTVSTGDLPLRVVEFRMVFPMPRARMFGALHEWKRVAQGQSFCLKSKEAELLCWDAVSGLPLEATLGGTRVAYENWEKVGSRSFPMTIVLYYQKHMLLIAHGTLDKPDRNISYSPLAENSGPSAPPSCAMTRLISDRRTTAEFGATSGFVLLQVQPNYKGDVTGVNVLGADTSALETPAKIEASHLRYLPVTNGSSPPPCHSYYLFRGTIEPIGDLINNGQTALQELLMGPRN